MLIRNAEVEGRRVDVRCGGGRILEIADRLAARAGSGSERELDAGGGALVPGLHDHHLHLLALAAALESIDCGPPAVCTGDDLRGRLREASPDREGWLRGRGYHDSVAGALDRDRLDGMRADLPVRIQHRSGAMWLLNSEALRKLGLQQTETLPEGVERDGSGRPTGRLFRLDGWLRSRLPSRPEPVLDVVGRALTQCGVTGVSDATPCNGPAERALLQAAQQRAELPQRILLMGGLELSILASDSRLGIGACKRLLDEPTLPDLAELVEWIRAAHALGRPVALHAVTRIELHFALAALEEAGTQPGDRIEHASVAPDETIGRIRQLGLTIVTQPGFVAERGDAYRREVDPRDLRFLYRVRSWRTAGIALAGGTDAPFGAPDPWRAMRAAVERRTGDGEILGGDERITPEEALALFTTDPRRPGGPIRRVRVGEAADLCLLDLPWQEARGQLARERVRATFVAGEPIDRGGDALSP